MTFKTGLLQFTSKARTASPYMHVIILQVSMIYKKLSPADLVFNRVVHANGTGNKVKW